MAVIVECKDPVGLKAKIKNAVTEGDIDTWIVDSDGDLKYETETISTSFVTYFPSDNPSIAIAITSPNISYKNKQTSYIYPFNKMVISRLTNYFLN